MQLKQQEVNSATGLNQQTPPGQDPASGNCWGAGERAECQSVSRIPLSTCSSPLSICLHSVSNISNGNEGCSPLTSPVRHILAGFKPAAGHFIKWQFLHIEKQQIYFPDYFL